MAIYHLHVKIVKREDGRSIVGAAAYRAGAKLFEASTRQTHDYTHKRGVHHSEILAPAHAPEWVFDRERLWNTVDGIEKRKDAQLARDIEIGLPVELNAEQQVALVRDYVQRHFVSKGMIADFSIHLDNPNNPHAHGLLTLRRIGENGFGLKERSWNQRSMIGVWRVGWAEVANEHLALAGLAVRIDHRTLKAQGLDLTPGRKIGVSLERQQAGGLPLKIAERVAEQHDIARENGDRILNDPRVGLRALTHNEATFTAHDIARFLNTRTDGAEQFRAAYLKVTTSEELVVLGKDDRGRERYTSREMLEVERSLLRRTERLSLRHRHAVTQQQWTSILPRHDLNVEQGAAFEQLVASGDLKALVGIAGSGKSRLLGAAREAWEAAGYTVKGMALSGIAAEGLEGASGISSRTIASYELSWKGGRAPLTSNDVLVIDEVGMVGTRQLERVMEAAEKAHAKVVLVGDPEQLQAIEAGSPFRSIVGEIGAAELTQVVRQRHGWQKEATRQLSSAQTKAALTAYAEHGHLVHSMTREDARSALLSLWSHDAKHSPSETRLILTYTRDDVSQLNELVRGLRLERGELGHSEAIQTERGVRQFAVGDRLYFLRNEGSLGVKNGTLGTIEQVSGGVLLVGLDGTDRCVRVDTRFYQDLDYGYASTVHKTQGATVDRSYILATSYFDRHSTYVSLSRHRESATMFYATEDFGLAAPSESLSHAEVPTGLAECLSRSRLKEQAHDYLEETRPLLDHPAQYRPRTAADIDAVQQRAAERWLAKQHARKLGVSNENDLGSTHSSEPDHEAASLPRQQKNEHHLHRGLEDDLEI